MADEPPAVMQGWGRNVTHESEANFIQWTDEYSVGNAVIDFDHQTLINIINHLQYSLDAGASQEAIGKCIDSMVNYIGSHFAREEALMRDAKFPEETYEAHIAKHRDIEKTVEDIASLYKSEPQCINAEEVMAFLRQWLTQHILRSDKQYVPYINGL